MAKRKSLWGMAAIALALAALAGCTTFQASGLQMDVYTNGQNYERAGQFSQKKWTNRFLGWGGHGGTLFNLSSNAADSKVRQAIQQGISNNGGDAAVDVTIKYSSNPLHWILSAITFRLWVPGTVTVEGTAVRAVNTQQQAEQGGNAPIVIQNNMQQQGGNMQNNND